MATDQAECFTRLSLHFATNVNNIALDFEFVSNENLFIAFMWKTKRPNSFVRSSTVQLSIESANVEMLPCDGMFYFNFSFVFIAIRVVHSQSMNATILLRRQFHGGFIRRLSPSVWSIHFVFNFILWISNLILYFSLNDLRLRDIHECRRCSRHSFRKNGFYRAHVARSAHKIALRWNRMDFYDRQWKGLHVSFTCFLWDWLWRS